MRRGTCTLKTTQMSDSAETTQQKMDRRKKRTSTNQYMMYIEMMEKDPIFATGRVPRDYDTNYLSRKWKELSDKLNECGNGPTLTSEEWRKVSIFVVVIRIVNGAIPSYSGDNIDIYISIYVNW